MASYSSQQNLSPDEVMARHENCGDRREGIHQGEFSPAIKPTSKTVCRPESSSFKIATQHWLFSGDSRDLKFTDGQASPRCAEQWG